MSSMSVGKMVSSDMGLLVNQKPPRPPPTYSTGQYQINRVHTVVIVIPPLLVLYALLTGVPMVAATCKVMVFLVFAYGLGVTAGYHRLFAHTSYIAHPAVQWAGVVTGAGAFEGSAKWWCRNHRIHHRYIDTDKDPYNAKRGFLFSHIGWMLMKQDYEILGRVDVGDLNANPIIIWQHKYYFPLSILMALVLPVLVCGLGWGDWVGGFFYGGLLKMVILHNCTFCINSLAHTNLFGAVQNYSEAHTSHDSWLCAVITMGEGYHNFHHEFSHDYRNGIKWYHWDPTKWLIRSLELAHLARRLVRTPNAVIARSFAAAHQVLHERKAKDFAKRVEDLERQTAPPATAVWEWAEYQAKCKAGGKLMVIGAFVLDLDKKIPIGAGYTHRNKNISWYECHPGGKKLLDMYIGKDATEAFAGGIFVHPAGATNIMKHLQVAAIKRDFSN